MTPCDVIDICMKDKWSFVWLSLLNVKANAVVCIAKSVMKIMIIIDNMSIGFETCE